MQEMQTILPAGSVIKDRYVVEELLGRGGFGAVYRVRDKRVGQNIFALKEVIDPHKRERERFTLEAELLKRVDHPALPRIYRVFEDNQRDRSYILMDYIDGPNLEILRQRMPNKRLPLARVLRIMRPIMNALDYLHAQRPPIIHRDVKPSNIIVPESSDEAVLVDFGIAKEFDPEATTTAVRHASPGYGAPEQYGEGTNARTDIYGLGATIYALLAGKVPIDAFYRATQMGARGTDPLEPVNQLVPEVPQHVVNAIQRAMSIDNTARFASAEEFWQALHAGPITEPVAESVAEPISEPVAPRSDALVLPGAEAVAPFALPDASPITPLPFADSTVAGMDGRPIVTERRVVNRRKAPLLLFLLFALLLGIAAAALLLPGALNHRGTTGSATPSPKTQHSPVATTTHSVTPSPGVSPTAAPSPTPAVSPTPTIPPSTPTPGAGGSIPSLASTYGGPIHNQTANVDSTMSLNSIHQNQQNISGNFTVNQPLSGNGPFTGTVTAGGSIQFTVNSTQIRAPLLFTGTIQSNGSMGGSYCSIDSAGKCDPAVGGYGTWSVSPGSLGAGTSSGGFPDPLTIVWPGETLSADRVGQSPARRSKSAYLLA